ncbi:unnamed protein product, partial [Choristocarpus tenellus]
DSGANVHLAPDREDLRSTRGTKRTCTFGNNGKLEAKETGDMVLMVTDKDGKPTRVVLKDVLWAPGLSCRILSTGSIRRNGGELWIQEQRKRCTSQPKAEADNKGWDNILGHINPAAIKHLEKRGLLEITDATVASELQCETCKECKSDALSYQRGGRTPKQPGEVVHTDLAGPAKADITGHQYFQVFVDESSRDKRVYGLKTKNAATDATAAYI